MRPLRNAAVAAIRLLPLAIMLMAMAAVAEPSSVLQLDEARFLYLGQTKQAALAPSGDDADWTRVQLPHFWPLEHPGDLAMGWYRFEFERPEDQSSTFGVYMPHFESNARVFINGSWIGEAGPPGSLNWNQPVYFQFPADVLKAGLNAVDVSLEGYGTPGAGLHPIALGPHALLYPRWQTQWWFRVGATEVGTVLAVFTALLFGAIWLGKSRDPLYGWCSLMAVTWGINSLNYHVQEIPVSYWTWKWLVHAGLDLFATCTAFLILRLVDIRMPRVERAILAFGGLAVVVPVLLPREYFFTAANLFHGGSLLIGCVSAGWLVRLRKRLQPNEFRIFLLLEIVFVGLLIRDYAIQVGWLPPDSPRLFHLSAPVLFSGFAITLLMRFIGTYRDAERTNVILEQRVQEKQAELELHFSRLSELEQMQAVSHERERIMREMHDGLGGHLVSALALVEEDENDSSELAGALRSSLDEMRLVIFSLDSGAGDITASLGTLRERLEPALRRAGIQFRWRVTDLPGVHRFRSEHHLHILRICQEAMTNVLKHSGASVITVATGVETDSRGKDRISIRISDDGTGISTEPGNGSGIRNMRFRAGALDGELSIVRLDEGTEVKLRFPVSLD